MFFEAEGADGRTRILSLDSQDGYLGLDFHRGPSTYCGNIADLSPGGPCEPSIVIGVDTDGDQANPGIRNARQFKIGYPTRQSTAWNAVPGTFMIFAAETTNPAYGANGFSFGHALWDGARWQVQYDDAGCPKRLMGVQAAMPVHQNLGRYKVYFNRRASQQSTLKPMRLLYGDATTTGDPNIVEFEDWEPVEEARTLRILWPDGTQLTPNEESIFDDYVVLEPDPASRRQIMLTNLSTQIGGISPPFIAMAVLRNP